MTGVLVDWKGFACVLLTDVRVAQSKTDKHTDKLFEGTQGGLLSLKNSYKAEVDTKPFITAFGSFM